MATLPNIDYAAGQDTFQDFYDSHNDVIDVLNATLATTVVEIGDWNMDADQSVNVAHGIGDHTKIRDISVIIRADVSDATLRPLNIIILATNSIDGGVVAFNSTNVTLGRVTGGFYDSTAFDSTSFNRGWVTIKYQK